MTVANMVQAQLTEHYKLNGGIKFTHTRLKKNKEFTYTPDTNAVSVFEVEFDSGVLMVKVNYTTKDGKKGIASHYLTEDVIIE